MSYWAGSGSCGVRLSPEALSLVEKAADLSGETVSGFVRSAVLKEAERLMPVHVGPGSSLLNHLHESIRWTRINVILRSREREQVETVASLLHQPVAAFISHAVMLKLAKEGLLSQIEASVLLHDVEESTCVPVLE